MRCENGRRGFVAAMRSSIERRRVSNAKVTSLRQRKYQELTMQREQENLQRAKAILERRKSERDRLNAYMHSVGNPHAKHADHFKRMQRPNIEGMFGRPPWTDSLRNDYETLIKLREKEIAVTTLRIENQKDLPTKSMPSEVKGGCHIHGRDESYLLKNGSDFHHDNLEPKFGRFDALQKINGASMQHDMRVLKHELFAFPNEAGRYHTDIGRNLLLMEPTVFREHSLSGLRPGPPTSNPKVFTPPLKSCLKSNNHNQKFLSPPSESLPQVPSERHMHQPAATTSKMEPDAKLLSNGPQTRVMATSAKAVKNHDMFSWSDHYDMDYFNDFMEYPNPQPAHDTSTTEEMSTASNVGKSTPPVPPENSLPDVRPTSDYQIEDESMMSCSGADPQAPGASSPSETAQPIASTLPPRYTSTCESWQEAKEYASSILDEYPSPSPPREYEDKTWGSNEEMFITSLDSEAATTRLIAEVIAVQSRLEDCKLKPLDFRNIFAEPPFPDRGRTHNRAETTLEEESSVKCPQPATDGYEIFHSHKEQGTIEVTMRNHEIFAPDDTREDGDCRGKESASNAVAASSVDDHEKDTVITTNRVDNFTEMQSFEEAVSRKTLHGTAREIHEAEQGVGAEKNEDSPVSCTTTTPPKPVGVPKQPRGLEYKHPFVKHVLLQTDDDLLQNARCPLKSEGISTNVEDRAESTGDRSDCALLSTKRTSKYLNIGYRDLSEAPRPKYPKQHCFYSSHGLLQVGYSQPRQSPKPAKPNVPQNNKPYDSLGDKENYGMGGSDDQELSILASLERLDWKLAAMSARVKNRASITPSMVSQNQNSVQSAPAATGNKGASGDGTPRKLSLHPLRPSSVRTQKPPTRNFRRRRIVGVTNKFHQDDYD